jgi:hypothetical protein
MPLVYEIYTPRESELAVIDALERSDGVILYDLIKAYNVLAESRDHHGDRAGAQQARDQVAKLSSSTTEELQQFFIDRMEEHDDIDLDKLSMAYEKLSEIQIMFNKPDEAEESKESAKTLRSLFHNSGRTPRQTPRSTIPISYDSTTNAVSETKSSPRNFSQDKDNYIEEAVIDLLKPKKEAVIDVLKPKKEVHFIKHDSCNSPLIFARPSSKNVARAQASSESESKKVDAVESKEESSNDAKDADAKSVDPTEAKEGDVADIVKTLRISEAKEETYDDEFDDVSAGEDMEVAMAKEVAREATGNIATAGSSVMPSPVKSKKPMLFLTWDGEPDSWQNVDKLMRMLKAKGYIVFEHAGGDCTGSSATLAGFDAKLLKSGSQDSLDGMATATLGSIGNTEQIGTQSSLDCGESLENALNATSSISMGASARAKVSQEIVDKMSVSTVFVACVTRNFTKNVNCKKLVLRMRELQIELGSKKGAEMLYVMVHGTFTTESQPYHCRDGWLGYLLRDSLWSPAWSHAHVAGAAEAISATVSLRRSVVRLLPQHILYIESRGRAGVCPPCFTKPR